MTRELITTATVRDHFTEALENALEHYGRIGARPETLAYLVELLCDFIKRPVAELDRPLALVFASQAQALPDQALIQLKRVGDDALYLCGFFRESLSRHSVGVDYYCDIGGQAYRRLGRIIRRRDRAPKLVGVYVELADRFALFSDVLADVRLQTMPDDDVGQLYEKWLKTHSRALEHKLRASRVVDLRTHKGTPN